MKASSRFLYCVLLVLVVMPSLLMKPASSVPIVNVHVAHAGSTSRNSLKIQYVVSFKSEFLPCALIKTIADKQSKPKNALFMMLDFDEISSTKEINLIVLFADFL